MASAGCGRVGNELAHQGDRLVLGETLFAGQRPPRRERYGVPDRSAREVRRAAAASQQHVPRAAQVGEERGEVLADDIDEVEVAEQVASMSSPPS